jgi:hypothetical protein
MSSDMVPKLDPKSDFKVPTKREKKLRKTFEKMEGFSFVTTITGLYRPNSGKDDDNDVQELLLKHLLLHNLLKNGTCSVKYTFPIFLLTIFHIVFMLL